MHFLFTAPVYHTNQHYTVKALLDAGHEVSFLALVSEHSARSMTHFNLLFWVNRRHCARLVCEHRHCPTSGVLCRSWLRTP